MSSTPSVGCPKCFQAAPDAVWHSRPAFRLIADLIDECHFHVVVLECPACGQRSVSIFSETIDWVHGDDAQHWTIVPITVEESECLISSDGSQCVSVMIAMGPDRPHLAVSRSTRGERTISWSHNFCVEPC